MRVEHGFELEALTATTSTLSLEAVDFRIDLARVYNDVGI